MKIGVEIRIDVKKIEKARLYQGAKGTYLTLTGFIDTEQQDQYGNNGFIAHKTEQNEDKAPILGNSKVFWTDGQQSQQASPSQNLANKRQQSQQSPKVNPQEPTFDDDVPF